MKEAQNIYLTGTPVDVGSGSDINSLTHSKQDLLNKTWFSSVAFQQARM